MNEPKQHHYVPRHYLRHFCNPATPSRIHVYDKITRESFNSSIARVGKQNRFYLVELEKGISEEIEGPASVVLSRVMAGDQASTSDKWLLSKYVALFIKRVPAYRQKVDTMLQETSAGVIAQIQAEIDRHVQDPALRATRLREIEELQKEWREGPPAHVRHFVHQPWITEEFITALFSMAWHFFTAPCSSKFATCDNPVFWFETLGVGNEYSELSIPLSSDLCLVATRAPIGDMQRREGSERIVRELNRRMIVNATRHIYYNTEVDWLKRMVAKKNYPSLNRIYKVPRVDR